jgi:predicted DNA-binding transcriptional regulator YafY
MPKYRTIKRYLLIIEIIKKRHYPSFQDIKDYLSEHDFAIGDRTIQRDLEEIRLEFGLAIEYTRDMNGYFIDYKNSFHVESFFRFLEIVNTAELLTESLLDSKETLQYINFDTGGGFQGTENLRPLLGAIKERRIISFLHYNYHSSKNTLYEIYPYLLKEYQNRWYIVGVVNESKQLRTFGLDRMDELEVKPETFIWDKKLNPAEKFDQTIGLMYDRETPQEIILSFTHIQGKYIKSLPWHHSQKVLIDTKEELRISLMIIPNYELLQLILKHGNQVKVIEPQWLVEDVQAQLKATLKLYA